MKLSGIKTIVVALLTVVVLAGCNKKNEAQLEETFALKYRQTATIGNDLEIRFTELSDSRCAADVECVIPGELDVTLKVNNQRFDLLLGNMNHSKVKKDGFEIQLLDATPQSFTSTDRPRKKDYVLYLVVRKTVQ